MEAKKKLAAWLMTVCILLSLAACGQNTTSVEDEPAPTTTPKIGYAEGVTSVEDPDALQKAVDEMYAEAEQALENAVALEYKNDATSSDGINFSCYIANSLDNKYDMYLQIFADSELTDQLLLTGLIRPGSAFDNITLEHALEPGTHRVYTAFTQVEEDLATIHNQVMVTMDFHVTE